ncbi:hypothetical protein R1sor_005562 [Riccia sorocarpa]|uniref:Uncharacterized protein n=1 Tax=Riccia sorocarpa TaxID=122646 RepID=A0ABD3HM69_9MARC
MEVLEPVDQPITASQAWTLTPTSPRGETSADPSLPEESSEPTSPTLKGSIFGSLLSDTRFNPLSDEYLHTLLRSSFEPLSSGSSAGTSTPSLHLSSQAAVENTDDGINPWHFTDPNNQPDPNLVVPSPSITLTNTVIQSTNTPTSTSNFIPVPPPLPPPGFRFVTPFTRHQYPKYKGVTKDGEADECMEQFENVAIANKEQSDVDKFRIFPSLLRKSARK